MIQPWKHTSGTALTLGRKCRRLLQVQPMKTCIPVCSFHQPPSASKVTGGACTVCCINTHMVPVQGRQSPCFYRPFYDTFSPNRLFRQNTKVTLSCHQRTQMRFVHKRSATVQEEVTLENIFSDSNRQRVQEHLDTVKPVRTLAMMGVKEPVRVSAVLVPLCMVGGEPSVLFTLRSSSLTKHRGEVSFPGGNQDDTDLDHTHTALRETFEEVGLNPRYFDIWGMLSPTPSSKRAGDVVYPVLARYTEDLDLSTLRLNVDEVEEVFTCPIRDLCDRGRAGSTQFRTGPGYTLPVYLGAPYRIWGLTAIILHQTLTLIAPGLYTHKIRHVA